MPGRSALHATVVATALLAAVLAACSPPGPGATATTTAVAPDLGWTARALPGGVVTRWSARAVQVSRDDGATYVDLPPPTTALSSVRDVVATTSQVAVVAVVAGRPAVWLSGDAGDHWRSVTLVPPTDGATDSVGDVQIDVVDGRLSGLAARLETSSSFAAGRWYAAPTGEEASWAGRTAPGTGTLSVVGDRLWGVTGPTASGLAQSGDGGRTWSAVELRGCAAADGALTVLGRSARGQVVVAVSVGRGPTTQVSLCTSADGRGWRPTPPVDLPVAVGAGVALPGTLAGGEAVVLDPDGSRAVVTPVSGTPHVVLARGLPGGVTAVSAADADHLVADVAVAGCGSTAKASCESSPASYGTADGGRTWHRLVG